MRHEIDENIRIIACVRRTCDLHYSGILIQLVNQANQVFWLKFGEVFRLSGSGIEYEQILCRLDQYTRRDVYKQCPKCTLWCCRPGRVLSVLSKRWSICLQNIRSTTGMAVWRRGKYKSVSGLAARSKWTSSWTAHKFTGNERKSHSSIFIVLNDIFLVIQCNNTHTTLKSILRV